MFFRFPFSELQTLSSADRTRRGVVAAPWIELIHKEGFQPDTNAMQRAALSADGYVVSKWDLAAKTRARWPIDRETRRMNGDHVQLVRSESSVYTHRNIKIAQHLSSISLLDAPGAYKWQAGKLMCCSCMRREARVFVRCRACDYRSTFAPDLASRTNSMNKKTEAGAQLHVVLVCIPEALHGTLLSTLDVLRTAAMFAHFHHPDEPVRFTWEALCLDGATVSLPGLSADRFCQNRHVAIPEERTLYVIPGLHVYNSPRIGEVLDAHIDVQLRIKRHAEAGGWIAATHTGIGFPAKMGLLDGARIGAPWTHDSWFSRQFPDCNFSASEPFTRHGQIFTNVAPGLQVEFTLTVLAAMGYSDLASASAQILLYQERREELIHDLIEQEWTTKTADRPVYRAIEWLNRHIEQPYSLSALAAVAATSERTLLRHFQQVTGMTPLDYLQDLRVERAKMLLEVTLQTVHTIAQACGYSDVASFRKVFRSVTGTTPSEYRTRFALRTRRRYWRVEALAGPTPNKDDSSLPDTSTP